MPQQTTIHGWTHAIPDDVSPEDRDQWGGINESFFEEELDQDVPMDGPLTSRPPSGQYPGLIWIVTDDPDDILVTYDTGSEWKTIGGGDAETLDGLDSSELAVLSEDETVAGAWTHTSPLTVDAALTGALASGETISNLVGTNLSVDGDGALNASDTNTHVGVSDDTTAITTDTSDINFGANVSVTDDGDGSVTVDATDTDIDTDTHVDVADDGTAVLADVGELNFASNLSVTDSGNGSVAIDAAGGGATDTRVGVSDDGSAVLADATDINFATNLSVTDDGDGSVSVDAAGGGATDTRVNVSDGGAQILTDATDINFNTNLTVTDDGDGSVSVDAAGGSGGGSAVEVVASGTVTLSGGTATVSTGVEAPIDIYLDPSNGGANTEDIDVVASARYDASAAEMVVEIAEDSTLVGNPTVAYEVLTTV